MVGSPELNDVARRASADVVPATIPKDRDQLVRPLGACTILRILMLIESGRVDSAPASRRAPEVTISHRRGNRCLKATGESPPVNDDKSKRSFPTRPIRVSLGPSFDNLLLVVGGGRPHRKTVTTIEEVNVVASKRLTGSQPSGTRGSTKKPRREALRNPVRKGWLARIGPAGRNVDQYFKRAPRSRCLQATE
jgi:hypothetical protein